MSYDTAVTPGQGAQDPQSQNQANGTSGEFGTNSPSMANTPIPAVTPIQYPNQFNSGKSQGSSGGTSSDSGGFNAGSTLSDAASGAALGTAIAPGIGTAIGALGGAIASLFSGGGPVDMAAGGPAGADPHKKVALAQGYLTGALHQQKYGGDPSKLGDAAAEIKQMLMDKVGGSQPQQGFAGGGDVQSQAPQDDSMYVQQALLQSLGMGQNQQQSQDQADQSQVTNSTPDLSSNMQNNLNAEINRQPKGYAAGGKADEDTKGGSVAERWNKVAPSLGYIPDASGKGWIKPMNPKDGWMWPKSDENPNGYAQGGAGMMAPPPDLQGQGAPMQQPPGNTPGGNQGPPPLQPGQEFQGDGSVKGPGGPQSDSIPAKLSNGEFVMSAPATQFIGVDKLNQMNEKGKQGFMQALGQVQQNQQQPPQGGPGGPQMPPGAQQPPQPQAPPQQPPMASGGIARKKGYMDGFAGM